MERPLHKSLFTVVTLILLAFSSFGFTAFAAADADLVGYWPLDDGSGTAAADASGNNLHGVLTGSWSGQHAPVNFANSGSISLNGTGGQGVVAPLATAAVDNITLSAWVRWAGTNGKPQAILYNGDKAANGYGLYLQENGRLAVLVGDASFATSTYTLTAGTWQNVVAMRDAGNWKLFLDGKQIPLTGNPVPAAPSGQTTIGRTTAANTEVFHGLVDEVRIYTRVLPVADFAWKVFPLYLVNYYGNDIVKVSSSGEATILTSGGQIYRPDGLAVDDSGFLYVANYWDHKIIRVDPNSGEQTLLTSGGVISFPDGLAFDSSGMLYVASLYNDRIVQVNPDSGDQLTVAVGGHLHAPTGMVFDSSGMMFATSFFNDAVVKIDPGSGAQTLIASGGFLDGPNAIILDMDGMLYVSNEFSNNIVRVDPVSGSQTVIAGGGQIDNPYGMVFYDGSLYVSSMYNHKIVIVDPDNGEQTVFAAGGHMNYPNAMVFGPNYAADLALTQEALPDPVLAGENITYTLHLSNLGTDPASTVAVTDTLPASTTFVSASADGGWSISAPDAGEPGAVTFTRSSIHSSESAQLQITVKASAGLASGALLTNTAVVSSAYPVDPEPENNSTSVTTPVSRQADLSLTKSDQGASISPGDALVYTLQYANAGPHAASGVKLLETVPANTTFDPEASTAGWTCAPNHDAGSDCTLSIGALASGGSSTATFAVTVDVSAPPGEQITNTASIADDGTNGADPNPANNTASAVTGVSENSTTTTLVSSQNPTVYGQAVSFTAAVTSQAGTPGGTVTFTDGIAPVAGCQSVPLTAGQAVCTTSDLTAGTHSILATYNGSGSYGSSAGSLTPDQLVNPANPVLAWSPPADLVYPAALSDAQLNASSDIAGTFSYSPLAGTVLPAGSHTLQVTFTPADNLNYRVVSLSVTIKVVDGTAPVVTVPANLVVGVSGPHGAVVTFTSSALDDVDGPLTPTCTPSSGTTFLPGTTTVHCAATDQAGNTGSASFTVTVQSTHLIYIPITYR